ncbi:hypothetical protein BS47DRAFT_1036741 [Hydnum rufescens UP504]|uniref:Uncharacterized protein n=1 Tax=Hydnum rufescens UP504 TaxID=1448309 RepID=A0A9P6DWI4_9AGAM|nr:hypothetical protein BS47DRAFT_1036741 [Hydnum rufescens UP504]
MAVPEIELAVTHRRVRLLFPFSISKSNYEIEAPKFKWSPSTTRPFPPLFPCSPSFPTCTTMDTTTRQKAKWTERLRAVFTFRKRQNTNNHRPAEIPSKGISLNAIVAAENALRWIPVGGARDGIGAFLSVVKKSI